MRNNYPITEARRKLNHLVDSDQSFTLSRRGHLVAQVRVFAVAEFDQVKAQKAAERIARIGARAKPSKVRGATALVRAVRDGA